MGVGGGVSGGGGDLDFGKNPDIFAVDDLLELGRLFAEMSFRQRRQAVGRGRIEHIGGDLRVLENAADGNAFVGENMQIEFGVVRDFDHGFVAQNVAQKTQRRLFGHLPGAQLAARRGFFVLAVVLAFVLARGGFARWRSGAYPDSISPRSFLIASENPTKRESNADKVSVSVSTATIFKARMRSRQAANCAGIIRIWARESTAAAARNRRRRRRGAADSRPTSASRTLAQGAPFFVVMRARGEIGERESNSRSSRNDTSF